MMTRSPAHFKLILIALIFLMSACGGGEPSRSSPPEPGSTIESFYYKGPVSGAKAVLKNAAGDIVAGPVITLNGQATFINVSHTGLVYAAFSGGSYVDEATGTTVTLDADFVMHSGVINLDAADQHTLTATPLTEIGFQRAASQNGGTPELTSVNESILQVATDFGLESIDLLSTRPSALAEISGESDADRYGVVLAAISQQLLNESAPATSNSLKNYLETNTQGVDTAAFNNALSALTTNELTQQHVSLSLINKVQTATTVPSYSIGGQISGLTGRLVLSNNGGDNLTIDSNGAFRFTTESYSGRSFNVTVATQPVAQTCTVHNGHGNVGEIDVADLSVDCQQNFNYIQYAINESPVGDYWYVSDKVWERDLFYVCTSFVETGRSDTSIFLTASDGTEQITINMQEMRISSDQSTSVVDIITLATHTRGESFSQCPSSTNDFTPQITSAADIEVNSGRATVLSLQASDADLPHQKLSFSLTNNAASDNSLFAISNFRTQARAACRAGYHNQGHPEDPNNDRYYFIQKDATTLEACQAVCNTYPLHAGAATSCKGVEFRPAAVNAIDTEARCEIWTQQIVTTVPQPGYGCYTRESENPTVLSFKDTPDFRVPRDANSNNVYEVEAQVSDGEGGKTSTQTILVNLIPNGDYIGRSATACRAGYQNEGHPEDTNNDDYFTIVNDIDSVEDCQALCDAYPLSGDLTVNCTGIEYRAEGADYADTASRCELWKAPILATTPQQEYACYVRDFVRDAYGPANAAYVGTYKAFDDNVDLSTRSGTISIQADDTLLWTNSEGISWSLSRTADRHTLRVGADYPYPGDGYENVRVIWDAEEVSALIGPFGLTYQTDWAKAKMAHSAAFYQAYIDNHSHETTRVAEAQRQLRELRWNIAVQENTAQGYRNYIAAVNEMGFYGRKDEAARRIATYKAYVTAEVVRIQVNDAGDDDHDLELFYNLEFVKNWQCRAVQFTCIYEHHDALILESLWDSTRGSQTTTINVGSDRAYRPAGNADKTLEANESEVLRYGGLMFEYDSRPIPPDDQDGCDGEVNPFGCPTKYPSPQFFTLWGIYDANWQYGSRTWAGNAANAYDSLDFSYFNIALADLQYDEPKSITQQVNFATDEKIALTYEFTKRNEEQYNEYLNASSLKCEDPQLKPEKLKSRQSVDLEGPGFLIRNDTDHVYSLTLGQVFPLKYGEVHPGEIFVRNTHWGPFNITADINFTGEERCDDWCVIIPALEFSASFLHGAITGGLTIGSIEKVIQSGMGTLIKSSAAKTVSSAAVRSAATAMAKSAFGRALLRSGAVAIDMAAKNGVKALVKIAATDGTTVEYQLDGALDDNFSAALLEQIYADENISESTHFNGSGTYGSTLAMYHIVGGPRLPCVNSEGDIEIRASKLQILTDHDWRVMKIIESFNSGTLPDFR